MNPHDLKLAKTVKAKLAELAVLVDDLTRERLDHAEGKGLLLRAPFRVRSKSPDTGREEVMPEHFLFNAAIWEAFTRAAIRHHVEIVGADGVVVAAIPGGACHPMRVLAEEHNDLKRRFKEKEAEAAELRMKLDRLEVVHASVLAQMGKVAA